MSEIVIRDFEKNMDENFIYDSWMNSYKDRAHELHIPRRSYNENHPKLMARLISLSRVTIAVNSNDKDLIIGYLIAQPSINTVHYVYVKEMFRGFGICSGLLEDAKLAKGTRVTHLTDKGKTIAEKKGFIYSPYFNL